MANFIRKKLGVKISLKVNVVLLVVMIVGTYVLLSMQSTSLETKLLNSGKMQSIVGAKMVGTIISEAIDNGVFPINDVFDTHYEKIGDFEPPKYHTKYDSYFDKALLGIQDEFLQDTSVVYAIAVDKNGYLPTHNTRYQKPITGDREGDKVGNRTKRIFNDSVGIRAATNSKYGFLQVYYRDTGETMWDVSSPVTIKGKHWGAFRVGISLEAIEAAQNQLMLTLIAVMGTILLISIILIFFVVNSSLKPVSILADRANNLADGQFLEDEIEVTGQDETGELQAALDRLRISMFIALKRRK